MIVLIAPIDDCEALYADLSFDVVKQNTFKRVSFEPEFTVTQTTYM